MISMKAEMPQSYLLDIASSTVKNWYLDECNHKQTELPLVSSEGL